MSKRKKGYGRQPVKRHRGGQLGNQNARKHGFYSLVLDDAEKQDFDQAVSLRGIDDEIALLRVKIKSLVDHDPHNIKLVMAAVGTLTRMLRTKYHLGVGDAAGLKDAVGNILRDIVLPAGVNVGKFFKNMADKS